MTVAGASSSTSPAVGRALDILTRLAEHPGPVQASALARDLDVPRSSLYHVLSVLVDRGFVVYFPRERAYGLGVSSFEIGSAYLRHEPLERLTQPVLRTLARRLQQTVHLGIVHGSETLFLLKEVPSAGPSADLPLITDVGVRLPAHLTANGRAILAHLPEQQVRALFPHRGDLITRTGRGPRSLAELTWLLRRDRERGWSEEVQLVARGLRSVAAAVFDHGGRPVAALSTTWSRFDARSEPGDVAALLRRQAARLTTDISGQHPQNAAS